MRRIDAVVDLEALRVGDAHRAQLFVQSLAPDEHRDSVTTVAKLNRGAQHDFLFAFGEDDALGIVARGFIGERENRRGRVEPRAQPGAIFAQRSEEHTSELQSLMRLSYAVLRLKKK